MVLLISSIAFHDVSTVNERKVVLLYFFIRTLEKLYDVPTCKIPTLLSHNTNLQWLLVSLTIQSCFVNVLSSLLSIFVGGSMRITFPEKEIRVDGAILVI